MAIFITGTLIAVSVMAFHYMGLPNYLFGVGHYRVTLNLPTAGRVCTPAANVTYRGTEVGRVESVALTDGGVNAVLSLNSGVPHPPPTSDAEVHSQTAVGEQFVALRPRSGKRSPCSRTATSSPVDRALGPRRTSTRLLDATNRGIRAIPHDNLKTVHRRGLHTAVGGLGPELSRLVKGDDVGWPSTAPARTWTP